MSSQITCPHCKKQFDVDEVLSQEAESRISEQLKKQLTSEFEQKQTENKRRWREEFAEEAKNQAELMSEKLKNREQALEKLREEQKQILREKDKWEEEKRSLELENQKKLSEEKIKILAETQKQLAEEQELKLAEKDKKIADFEKQLVEMKRKLDQSSQQLQGEVLELQLEEKLREEFGADVIEAIGKGVNGADIRQKVYDKNGQACGTILWESKRTKNWTEGWVPKLKEDLRAEKANLAVLVSTVLPKEIKKFAFYQGIWICEPSFALQLATLLRFNLVRVNQVLASQENKDEKLEALYRYLTGPEFVQKIEALMETFSVMKQDLDKERRVSEKRLSEREQQLNKLMGHTASLYGGLQGVTKNSLPKVSLLELE